MKKIFSRALSIILTIVLLSQIAPLSGFAVSAAPNAQQNVDIPSVLDGPQEPVAHMGEDESLRGLDSKHFRNKDGSYTAVQYPEPVHFQDFSGEWQEIDNTLVDKGASYVPKANGLNVSLPKELGAGNRVTMFDVGVGLAISVPGASSEAMIVNADDIQADPVEAILQDENFDPNTNPITLINEEMEKVHNQRSSAYYPNAFPGADLEYTLSSDKLKENVIVREKQDEYLYQFTLDLNNLIAVPQKNGSISLNNAKTGQEQYRIEAPYAYDANGVIADDVLMLAINENVLTMTADAAWMNADDRAFPVILDPTYAHVYDATGMTEISVSSNWGKLSDIGFKLKVGTVKGLFKDNRHESYLRFDLPSLPGDAVVTDAALYLDANNADLGQRIKDWFDVLIRQTPRVTITDDGKVVHEDVEKKPKVDISAHKILGAWGELTGWSTKPKYDEEALSLGMLTKNANGVVVSDDNYTFDITAAVKEWASGGTNYGVMLKAVNEEKTDENYIEFASLRANFSFPLINPFPDELTLEELNDYISKDQVVGFWPIPHKEEIPLTDAQGNQVYDENGLPVYTRDENGPDLYYTWLHIMNFPILINYFDAEPTVVINYVCSTGLENYWSYQEVPMGRSGTAYVNQYSGGLTYVHPDAALTGERMPVTLAHTYVSNHTNNNGNNWNMKLGTGFRLNLFEEILPLNCYESQSGAVTKTGDFFKDAWVETIEFFRNIYELIKDDITDQNMHDSWLEILKGTVELPDYYTLIDGDGTEHTFRQKDWMNRYESELDPKLYLELNDTTKALVLKDEYGNQKVYSPLRTEHDASREYVYRYLTQVIDANGNTTTIRYSNDGKITQIEDATNTANRVLKVEYNGNYLKRIIDPTGKTTEFSYNTTDDLLTEIKYFDNTKTVFEYSSFGDRNENAWHRTQLAIVTTPDDYRYGYTYYSVNSSDKSTGYRIREVLSGKGGSTASYDPKEGMPTSRNHPWWENSEIATGFINFISPVWDWIAEHIILPILKIFNENWTYEKELKWFNLLPQIYGEDDTKKPDFTNGTEIETKSFVYDYNQTEITSSRQKEAAVTLTFDRLGRAVGAKDESSGNSAFIGYTEDGGVKNLPGYSAGAADIDNLLQNPSFESDGGWNGGAAETSDIYAGARAWKLTAGATASQKTTSIEKDETYTVSLYAKASAIGTKAELIYTQKNNIANAFSEEKTALTLTDKWERYTATFKAESTSPITIAINATNGAILVDAVQLEKNGGASPFNHVENSHFRFNSSWTATGDAANGYADEDRANAKINKYELVGNLKDNILVQSIPLNGKKDDTIVFGATAKIAATSEDCYVSVEFFKNGASIAVQNGKEKDKKDRKASFNRDVIAEQSTAASYVLPDDCTEMRLYIHNDNQVNDMAVYNAFVFKGIGGTKYSYENGKIKQATSPAGTATYTYNNQDLIKIEVRKPGKAEPDESVEYKYDGKHNVTLTTEAKKSEDSSNYLVSQTQYNYNDSAISGITGILIGSSVVSYSATKNSQGKYTPTSQILANTQIITYRDAATYNEVAKVEDGNGNWVKYTYKTHPNGFLDNSLIAEAAASDGSKYTYGYDSRDLLTNILSDQYKNEYSYTTKSSDNVSDALKSIVHTGTTYSFGYNELGQVLKTQIGGQTIAENTYYTADDEADDETHQRFALSETKYANGFAYRPQYDEKGRIVGEKYFDSAQNGDDVSASYEYTYSKDSALSKVLNKEADQETQLGYDMMGRLTDVHTKSTIAENESARARLSYNNEGMFVGLQVLQNDTQLSKSSYEYDDFDRPKKVVLPTLGGKELVYTYNPMTNNLDQTSIGNATTAYAYSAKDVTVTLDGEAKSVKIPEHITQMATTLPGANFTYDYTYVDQNADGAPVAAYGGGNIKSVTGPEGTHTYTYDKIGQLTDDNTTHYDYDTGGNLLSIKESGAVQHSFAYNNANWKDQLSAFDGKAITYDEIGNLETYDGNTYKWQKASQLASISGNVNAQYTYDYTGLRSSKTVGGVTTNYIWAGGLLMAQDDGANTIAWSYDGSGTMLGFTLNDVPYFYLRNLQGDVVGIYDAAGQIVGTYEYDAWGNIINILGALAFVNPIRYRGYYYDTETNFYYLQSRYYSPELCRFISADVYMDTGDGILGTNMYAYCQGDPVNRGDPSGQSGAGAVLPSPMSTLDAWKWLIQQGYQLSASAGPLAKSITAAVGAIAVLGVGFYGQAMEQQFARSLELQARMESAQKELENNNKNIFFPAYLNGKGQGITVNQSAGMNYIVALQYVLSGGDVWVESKSLAYCLAILGSRGGKPISGNMDVQVVLGKDAKHYHLAFKDGYGVHIFYGRQAVTFTGTPRR